MRRETLSSPLVSTDWLAERLTDPELVLLDGSWHMPNSGRSASAEYLENHLPGAVFFDIDEVADKATGLPHMLPDPETFGRIAGGMGISDTDTIVVYDEIGVYSAPRVWWTFRVMGARNVHVLDGGAPKWRAEGRPTDSGPRSLPRSPRLFSPRYNPGLVAAFSEVLELARSPRPARTIVDARPANRFGGEVPEPRPGLRAGHIPGSLNLPFTTLTSGGQLRPATELAALAGSSGIDLTKPVVASCGSGITAATLALALTIAGAREVAVYDGSWAEWGGRDDAPTER